MFYICLYDMDIDQQLPTPWLICMQYMKLADISDHIQITPVFVNKRSLIDLEILRHIFFAYLIKIYFSSYIWLVVFPQKKLW